MEQANIKPDLVSDELASHEESFAAHFDAHIKSKLKDLENQRLRALAESRKRVIPAIFFGICGTGFLGFLLLYAENEFLEELIVAGIAAVVVGLYFFVRIPADGYTADRKQILIPEVLSFVSPFRYVPTGGPPDEMLKASHLFSSWTQSRSEDLIAGTYNGRSFAFAELVLMGTDRDGDFYTKFRGFVVWMEVEPTEVLTIAVEAKGEAMKFLYGVVKKFKGLRQVPFDQMDFEAEYDVYSLPIRLTPMTATCRVPPLSRVKLGIGWSRGVARDAEQ